MVQTYQIRVEGLFNGPSVTALELGGPQSVGNVKGAGVESSVLMVGEIAVLAAVLAAVVEVRLDGQRLGVESAFASAADLFVDVVERLGHVEGRADAHGRAVQMAGPDLGHMADAIDLLVVVGILVVVVGFERQLGAACRTLETALMEKCKVLQWADAVHLVHRLVAPETEILVKVHHFLTVTVTILILC